MGASLTAPGRKPCWAELTVREVGGINLGEGRGLFPLTFLTDHRDVVVSIRELKR